MAVVVISTRSAPEVIRRPIAVRPQTNVQQIQRREEPYWQERGWIRRGEAFAGTYQTPYGSFRGTVEDRGWNDLRFYIEDPPRELRESSHWACFQPRGARGYHVHMARRPGDVSSGILTIERLITDAFEGTA